MEVGEGRVGGMGREGRVGEMRRGEGSGVSEGECKGEKRGEEGMGRRGGWWEGGREWG